MVTDPIGDMIIRIKNAGMVKKKFTDIPYSHFKENILNVLKEEGYIKNFEIIDNDGKKHLRVHLLYDSNKKHVISNVKKISTPGCRVYTATGNIPKVKSGYGMVVLSTSKGVLSSRKAHTMGIGGELLFSIW